MPTRLLLWTRLLEYTILNILNIEYGKHTTTIAFADDLLLAVKAETVREAENYADIEIRKITNWAKENKITLNEQKSKVMVI